MVVLESTGDRPPYRNSYKMSYMPLKTVVVAPVVSDNICPNRAESLVPAATQMFFTPPALRQSLT